MVFDISDASFKDIMGDKQFYLPIRWDGTVFEETLNDLFDCYIRKLELLPHEKNCLNTVHCDIKEIKRVCGLIIRAVKHYLNGFPPKSYSTFERVMESLAQKPLRVYQKSVREHFENVRNDEDLNLFRATSVDDNKPYPRSRVFHTPYNLRSKVSTNRYSIAGYPSLYLGTSLELCCEEIHVDPRRDFVLASRFEWERSLDYTNVNIRVIELGVKPQDFVDGNRISENYGRFVSKDLLRDRTVRSAYLLWYPLVAACSYIRTSKRDPFAAEYIIPQLVMQWVRSEMSENKGNEYDQLIGIRYFSCASTRASDMGFNYVFPTSGQQKSAKMPFCSVLTNSFRLSEPVYIHEYENILMCERALRRSRNMDYIGR